MPHESTLPPIPASILTPYQRRRKLEHSFAARRYAESGKIRQHSANPDDDALLALQAALQAGADPKEIQNLLGQAETAHKTGFKERFLNGLRAVGLPFEAFSESVNALIGPAVPQQKFQERSAQSRQLLKSMFGGDLSVAEAAGALRDVYEQRSGWEQLITGLIFDPTNILVPGAIGIKAGIKAGAQAGIKTGAKAGARSYLEWQLPFVGGRIAGRLGLEAVQHLAKDAAKAAPPPESARMRLERMAAEYQPAGGSGEFESLLSRATPSEQATLRSAMGQFYEAVDDPARFADVPGFDRLVRLHKATTTPAEKALFQLTLETAGRGFEPAWAQVQDIIWADNRILFHAKTREPGAARLSPPLTDQTMQLLQQITAGKAPTDPIFLKSDLGIKGPKGAPLGAAFNTWLKSLGERAGETLPTGITIRNLVASAYRALLERGGAPVSLTRHLLGHADDRLFTSYTARAGMPQENLSLLRFMDENEVFQPLSTKAGRLVAPPKEAAGPKLAPRKRTAEELLRLGGYTKPARNIQAEVAQERRVARSMRSLSNELESGEENLLASFSLEDIEQNLGIDLPRMVSDPDVIDSQKAIPFLREEANKVEQRISRIAAAAETSDIAAQEKAIQKALIEHGPTEQAFEATVTAAKGLAAEVKAAPEFADVISRKGRGVRRAAQSAQARLGEVKIDALDITEPETWAPRLAAIKSDVDHDLLLDALRAAEAQRAILMLEQAEEAAKLVQEVAGKDAPIAVRMHKFAVSAFRERNTVALGLRDRLVNEVSPRLSKIREILSDLKGSGLVDDRDIAFFMEQMNFLPVTVKATLDTTKSGFVPHRVSVAAKALKEMQMTSADTAEMFHLSGIEKADPTSATAAVREWLDNDKVRNILHTMGILTVEKEIGGVKRWVVQAGAPALVTKLHRMASVGSTTQHILGADLVRTPSQGGLNETRRLLRAETVAIYIAEAGRLDSHDYLIAKASKGIAKPLDIVMDEAEAEAAMSGGLPPTMRGHTDQPPYEEPFLRRSTSRETEAKSLITPVSVERSIRENIRGNPKISRAVDAMERNMAEGHLPALNKIGRNLLQFVTLPAASYGTVASVFKQAGIEVPRRVLGRYVAGWRDSIMQIEAFREVARVQIIEKMPGYKSLMLEKMVDPRSPIPWFSDSLEMEFGFKSTDEWKSLVKKFQNYTTDAQSGLQMIPPSGLSAAEQLAYNALHNPAVLFGSLPAYGLEAIPLERLSTLYKLSAEELEFVGLIREIPRAGTRLGIAGAGASKMKEFLGKEASRDYFPRFAVKKGLKKFQKPPLGARPLGQPGVWAKERAIGDAFDAWDNGVFYASPFDSALDYVADMQRVVADQELIKLLQKDGFMEVGHKRWDTVEASARTLLGLAESIKKGVKPGVAVEQIAKLLGYADPEVAKALKVDELTRNMGKLAQDLLDNPSRVDDLMPDIVAKVKESENAVRTATQMHDLTKGLPGLGKMWFESTVQAQRAIKYFGEQDKAFTKWMQTLNKGSSALRMMQAGVDISFLFIQGLTLPTFGLLTRGGAGAKIWARSARAALKVHNDPAFMEAYAAHNAEAIKEFVTNAGVWNLPHEMVEQVEFVSRAYGAVPGIRDIPVPILGGRIRDIPRNFERMFSTYLMYARLELWKSLRPMAGTDGTKLHELSSFVNKMTGVYNPATAGITQFQRYMEGSFMSFAPMYRRAAYGLIVDAFRGVPGKARLDARLAQEALVSLAVVGTAIAYAIEQSGNNPEALDPGSAKFMSVRVGDSYVGFGSAYYSLIRAIYSVTEQALDPARRGQLGQIWNVRDNQFTRWWRSQAPPIPQAGLDIVLGQTYIGEPLRGEDGGFTAAAMGTWALGQVAPMALENVLNEVRGVSDSPIVLGESFGMRTFPISVRDKYRRLSNNTLLIDQDSEVVAWRREQEQSGNPVVFDSAPRLIQDRLVRMHPELQAARAEVEKDTLLRGKSELRERTEYFQQTKKNKEFINKRMQAAVAGFTDTHDSRKFRSAVKEAQTAGFALAVRTSEQFPDVKDWLDDLKQTRTTAASGFLGDLIYDKYYANVVLNPLTEDENGNFLPDMYDRLLTQFKTENGLEWWDYVQKRRKEARQHPDLVEEYFSAKESLQPYWKLHYTIWGQYSEDARLIDDYNSAAPDDKDLMEAGIPRLRRALKVLRVQRLKYREQNPELDWLLAKWYGNEPRTRLARERLAAWQSQR